MIKHWPARIGRVGPLFALMACSSGAGTIDSERQVVYDGGTGPFEVSVTDETLAGETVTWYEPSGGNGFALAWSHGFARSPENHATAAARAASWGFLVGVPELPSLSDQEVNAEFLTGDLHDAAIAKGAESVGYVGHSAGGLASLLAASVGGAWVLVGLDGTDVDDLGVAAAPSVTAPTLLLAGEPSACNADGNGRAWTTSSGLRRLAVNSASHCDFESDTDSLCDSLCGAHDPARQDAVQAWTIAWLLEVAGEDVGAWSDGGDEEASEVTEGLITPGW
ncbi:hypothetical protein LBMAG42_46270 [Deltaproteobacteria bacterium]|nr:hypothetical protein LBMAG42_46270 [Deltaproteobacteria bacterium]